MAQDFASNNRNGAGGRRKSASNKRTPAKVRTSSTPSAGLWFSAGLLCGVFICGLAWLTTQRPDTAALEAASPQPATAALDAASPQPATDSTASGPRFDFYTLLPEQKVEVAIDPASIATARSHASRDQFLLQAGSFKQEQDADRRRGELILLGLDAQIEKTNGDNGRWHRVYIGPFESRSKLAKARSLTAQQGIDTLLLKRPPKQG